MVDVAHGRADVRVAHVRLYAGQVPDLNGERAEGVAQVVKDDGLVPEPLVSEARDPQGCVEASA